MRECPLGGWLLGGQRLKPHGGTSVGGLRVREVWGIGGRWQGPPGGVELPVSGWDRGSLEMGRAMVERSLSDDLELWAGRVLLL